MWQLLASEQGHERGREREEPLVKPFQRRFATECIADEHRKEINDLILAEATSSEAHPFTERLKRAQMRQVVGNDSHLTKPRGEGRNRLRGGLDVDRRIRDTTHDPSS